MLEGQIQNINIFEKKNNNYFDFKMHFLQPIKNIIFH